MQKKSFEFQKLILDYLISLTSFAKNPENPDKRKQETSFSW